MLKYKLNLSKNLTLIQIMKKAAFNISEVLEQAHALKRNNQIEKAITLLEDINNKIEDRDIIRVLVSFLMDIGDYKRITEFASAQKFSPQNYIMAESFLKDNVQNVNPICLEGHQAINNAAFICMIKDEEDIIFFNLIWHYHIGFRKFFLINNMSTDHTLEQINLFEKLFDDTEVFVLYDPIVGYYQSKKTTGAARFAMTLWNDIEWIFAIDADEFLCPTQPLHKILADVPKNIDAIIAPKSFYNFIPGEDTEGDGLFFNQIRHRTPVTHISSKVIVRANLAFTISQGNHHVYDKDNNEISNYQCSLDLVYREFRTRSFAHHKRKVINGGQAILAAKYQGFTQVGGGHWEAVYNLYKSQGDIGLHYHLQRHIKEERKNTTIFDPFPLDKVIDAMNTNIKISRLIVGIASPQKEIYKKENIRVIQNQDEKIFDCIERLFIDQLPIRAKKNSTFEGDIGGVVLVKPGMPDLSAILIHYSDKLSEATIGLPSPVIAQQFSNNPFAGKARFIFKNVKLKKGQTINISAKFTDGGALNIFELKTPN